MTLYLLYTVSGDEEWGFYSDLRGAFSEPGLRDIAITELLQQKDGRDRPLYCKRENYAGHPDTPDWIELDEINLDELQ